MFNSQRSNFLTVALLFLLCLSGVVSAQSGRGSDQQQIPRRADEQQRTGQAPGSKDTTQQVDENDVVRVSTDLTNVLVTAVDKDKRFITSMKEGDIRVLENGVPQQVSTFQRETDLPLSLALLIDVSKSEEWTLPNEKSAAREFVQTIIRPKKDTAAVVSFTGDPTVEQELTNSVLQLEKAIDNVEIVLPPNESFVIAANGQPVPINTDTRLGTTAIWDAVVATSTDMLSRTPEQTRRAIILLTDGEDTSSRTRRQEAIDRAVKDNVVIYSIGIGDRRNYGIDSGALKKLSEKTGGRAFFPDNEMELRTTFAQIEDELRSQYLVAYASTNKARDGSFRRIEIEVVNPDLKKQKLRLLYRDGYFAKGGVGAVTGNDR
jgi:VWFA-related protein